jgi:hypothetical protein
MDIHIKNTYIDYIAEGIRYALKNTKLKEFPEDTIICVVSYSPLTGLDTICGFPIFICNIDTSFEFFLAFKAHNEKYYKLLTSFKEFLEMYPLELGE